MGDGEREVRSTFSLRAPLQERRKPRVPALERDLVGAALRQAQGRLQPRALAPSQPPPAVAGGGAGPCLTRPDLPQRFAFPPPARCNARMPIHRLAVLA